MKFTVLLLGLAGSIVLSAQVSLSGVPPLKAGLAHQLNLISLGHSSDEDRAFMH